MNKSSIIDFSNSNTFPLKLLLIVSDFYNKRPGIKKHILEAPNFSFDEDFFIQYAPTLQNALSDVKNELVDKTFILYHATMVDNTKSILQSGLKCFEKNEYVKYLKSILKLKKFAFLDEKRLYSI